MRAHPIALSCCAVLIGLTATTSVQAEAVKVTPQLTVFTKDDDQTKTDDGRPTVLRGDATRRGTVDARFGSYEYYDECFEDQLPCFIYK